MNNINSLQQLSKLASQTQDTKLFLVFTNTEKLVNISLKMIILVLLDKHIVIPKKFRKQILNKLHYAHQGRSTIQARANKSMYWLGINNHIKIFHDNCKSCSYNPPSQSKEPLTSSPQPEKDLQRLSRTLIPTNCWSS